MAKSSSVAIALAITARTGLAFQAIEKFTNKASERLAGMAKKSNEIMAGGKIGIIAGNQTFNPMKELVDKSFPFESSMSCVAKYADGAELGTAKFVQISQQALDLSVKLGVESGEVADIIASLAAAGVPIDGLTFMAEKTSVLGKAFDFTVYINSLFQFQNGSIKRLKKRIK
ncbi:MAG: phage tail tape measure protein [Weeksellaceae bacterium]